MSDEPSSATQRPGLLALVCDIPFFPGKMGVDFFNLRELARERHVGVVGPWYDVLPREGVQNLRRSVQSCYFWPEALPGLPSDARPGLGGARWLGLLPRALQRRLLHALVGLRDGDSNGLLKLAILANLAPYLLKAVQERRWQALVVIQSDTRAWFDYLPPHLPLAVYFHDVRSDYLEQRAAYERDGQRYRREARLAELDEREICERADAIGFVSELDRQRAERRLGTLPQASVAEIPLDLEYYRPPAARSAHIQTVLFTGLLSHPPNRDAALFFLEQVWEQVRERHPQAVFRVAGAFPPAELKEACRGRAGVELHADVPDIRPLFHEASVYVVPMRYGGGVRQKILEAWAMGVPVVLTPMAAEGSGAQDGVDCLIAPDAESLAQRVSELLSRPQGAAMLIEAGARRVSERHALSVATPQFAGLVQKAVQRRRQRPFRALLDLSWLRPGGDTPAAAGAHGVLQALGTLDTRDEYRLLATAATLAQLRLPRAWRERAISRDSWRERTAGWRAGLANELAGRLGTHRPMSECLLRLRFLNRLGCDLAHTFQGAPPSDLDLLPQVRSLLTLLRDPPEPQAEERERAACRRAELVLCPSEQTRQAAHTRWALPLERLRVVYPVAPAPALDQGAGRALREQLGLDHEYLLIWVEGTCPPALLEGSASALEALPSSWDLALVADALPAGSGAASALQARARLIARPGQLSPAKRHSLLAGALICALGTLAPRDFDLTLAEALSVGSALLLANSPLARELAGPAAVFSSAESREAWSAALAALLRDPERAAGLRELARARAGLFSLEEHARNTVAAYQAVHAGALEDAPSCE